MNYYLDIKVLPDLESSAQVLLNNLFAKFHRAVSQTCLGKIGVSFPDYAVTVGETLRLHGNKENLELLMAQNWLKGLRDYTEVSEIKAIPTNVEGYRNFARIQKKSPHNLRKRAILKGRYTPEEALVKIPDSLQINLDLPFMQIQSLSTKQIIRIFIKQGETQKEPSAGEFSSYGLSRTATVPVF